MTDEEIMQQLIEDAEAFELDCELDEFIYDNPNLTVKEVDEQFRNKYKCVFEKVITLK